ncbi:hypothetical protein IB75_18210, partial [Nitrosococcus oceani C-27]
GRVGSYTLLGNAGVDQLNGGGGNDNIASDGDGGVYSGDDGNDLMFSGLGSETMDGGTGIDTIDHTVWDGAYTFNMPTGLNSFGGEIYLNFEIAKMGDGNDTVAGNNEDNTIFGG